MFGFETGTASCVEPSLGRTELPSRVQRLSLEELNNVVISPMISPLPTAIALISIAMCDRGQAGAVPELRRALRSHLRECDVVTLRPLRSVIRVDGSGGCPNEIVPALPGSSMADVLDAVRAVEPERLREGIAAAAVAGHLVGAWRGVAREPARWLRAYVDALGRAWQVLEPMWSRAAELLKRDVERVNIALARGALAEVLTQLYPQSAVVGDELWLPSHTERSGRVRLDESLELCPLVAPVSCARWIDDYRDVCLGLHYSLQGAWRVFDGQHPPPVSLATLVGPVRATILHRLEQPATAGELAEMLQGAPSMVTHHLRVLESAGLISRTRDGRHVWVHRSTRGGALTAMYEQG